MKDTEDMLELLITLACKLGLRKALCLLNLQKRLGNKQWIHRSYEDWHKDLPFMSVGAIKEHFIDLQQMGLVLYHREGKVKYYSINKDALEKLYRKI